MQDSSSYRALHADVASHTCPPPDACDYAVTGVNTTINYVTVVTSYLRKLNGTDHAIPILTY
jgi:hypothetical protein